MKLLFLNLFIFILFSNCFSNTKNILTISQCIKNALNYGQKSIQLKQKHKYSKLEFKDFYFKTFNFNVSLATSIERKKDLSYSYYEYLYDTESQKSSLKDDDSITSSIDLEITKQFKFSTKATIYNKISTSSSFSQTDKDGDFSDTTLDQYSSYETKSYLYNPEIGLSLEHYILGKKPAELKFSLKNEEYKVDQTKFSNLSKNTKLISEIINAYYQYAFSLKIFEFKLKSYTESKRAKDFSYKIYKLGQISKYDYNKLEIELLQSNSEKEKASSDCMNYKNKLISLMGSPTISEFNIPKIKYENFNLSLENCKELLFKKQSDIETIKLKIKKNKNDITLAKKEFIPDVKIFGGIALEGNDKNYSDSYKKMKNKWNIGFNVDYSFYDLNSKKRKLDISKAKLIEQQANLKMTHDNYLIKLETAYTKLKQAEKMVNANTKKALLAKENMDFMKKKYYGGQADIDDFINAKKQYYSSEITNISSILKAFSSKCDVEKLINSGYFSVEQY